MKATITAKGQTTIPKEIREQLGLKPGDKIKFLVQGGTVRIARVLPMAELSGILHRPGMKAATIEEMDEGIAKAVAERDFRSLSPAGKRAASRRRTRNAAE